MTLLRTAGAREARDDYWLGTTTAVVAGLVNVCSVMAFFTFSSNVTGHVAVFVEEITKGHWHQVSVVVAWLLAFLSGAFVAHALASRLGPSNVFAGHGGPILLQIVLLTGTAYYGHFHYLETLWETECLVGVLLFAMGLQNATVSTATNSVVRTTHLTGLFTDLGMELSMLLQRHLRQRAAVRFKLKLHLLILSGYVLGGLLGGVLYAHWGFRTFAVAGALLLAILMRDLVLIGLAQAASGEHTSR